MGSSKFPRTGHFRLGRRIHRDLRHEQMLGRRFRHHLETSHSSQTLPSSPLKVGRREETSPEDRDQIVRGFVGHAASTLHQDPRQGH